MYGRCSVPRVIPTVCSAHCTCFESLTCCLVSLGYFPVARLIYPCALPCLDSGPFSSVTQNYFLLIYVDIDRTTSMTHTEEHIIIDVHVFWLTCVFGLVPFKMCEYSVSNGRLSLLSFLLRYLLLFLRLRVLRNLTC